MPSLYFQPSVRSEFRLVRSNSKGLLASLRIKNPDSFIESARQNFARLDKTSMAIQALAKTAILLRKLVLLE